MPQEKRITTLNSGIISTYEFIQLKKAIKTQEMLGIRCQFM